MPNSKPSRSYASLVYITAMISIGIETIYSFGWALQDIGVRTGLWWDDPAGEAFIATLTVWHETAFFTHVVLNFVAWWLLWRRFGAALPVYILAFACGKIDWIFLAFNTEFDTLLGGNAALEGYIVFLNQGLAIAALLYLQFEGSLHRKTQTKA
jgi:hypothetical protein